MLLILFALDPFGRFGPLMENFLNLTTHDIQYSFRANKSNATAIISKITRHPCPIGIFKTADAMWKTTKTRAFFDTNYTSPTPSVYMTQQLGLGITKAFATHIKNATKTMTHTSAMEQTPREATASFSIIK